MDNGRYPGTELELFREATNWKRYLRSQIAEYLAGDVLEVGAGLGGTTTVFHEATASSWTCLEPDGSLVVELARVTGDLRDRRGEGPIVRQGTLASLDSIHTYDTILYIDVLEHIEDDRRELAAAAAHLKTRGQIVVLSPAHQFLYTPFDRSIGHFRRYDRRSLRACAPPDTDLVRLRYLDSVGVLASLGNAALLRRAMPTSTQIAVWDKAMVPLSRRLDRAIGYLAGKSILAVWRRR